MTEYRTNAAIELWLAAARIQTAIDARVERADGSCVPTTYAEFEALKRSPSRKRSPSSTPEWAGHTPSPPRARLRARPHSKGAPK